MLLLGNQYALGILTVLLMYQAKLTKSRHFYSSYLFGQLLDVSVILFRG